MRLLKLICILTLILTLVSCQSNISTDNGKIESSKKELKQTKEDISRQEIADHLVDLACRIPQVNDATAIVFGKYAIVGIDIDAKLDRSHVGTVKYSVAESLKEDPRGATALITSDPDIEQRIREINKAIKDGHPIQAFADELSDIIARILPISPKPIQKKEEPPENTKMENNKENNDKNIEQEHDSNPPTHEQNSK